MRTDKRLELVKQIGCIGTMLLHRQTTGCDIHHLIDGNKRMGDDFTIGLSPWLHRGLCHEGWNRQDMSGLFGPSISMGSKLFAGFWGPQELLLEVQNLVISEYQRQFWSEYAPTYEERKAAIELWINQK